MDKHIEKGIGVLDDCIKGIEDYLDKVEDYLTEDNYEIWSFATSVQMYLEALIGQIEDKQRNLKMLKETYNNRF